MTRAAPADGDNPSSPAGGSALLSYRECFAAVRRGDLSADAFQALQSSLGMYRQRQQERYVVRIRLTAGRTKPRDLANVARLSSRYGTGRVHVTTRQNLQIHDVSLEGTVSLVEMLEAAGLSTRGSGGDGVRNVTACARASVCPKARFDVTGAALQVSDHLARVPAAQRLPRKLKIAFSGCGEDCAFASVSDLGFLAQKRDGVPGFSVHAGGGFGRSPALSVPIESFVGMSEVGLVAESIVRLFHRLGNWRDRTAARLRHVVGRLGRAQFVSEYRCEREAVAAEPLVTAPETRGAGLEMPTSGEGPCGFLAESDPGTFAARVHLRNGNVDAPTLARLARLAERAGSGEIVATQDQDLLLLGISRVRLQEVKVSLSRLGLHRDPSVPKVVACTGAPTCRLGICDAQSLANQISRRLEREAARPPSTISTVRVSGCPRGCGGHRIAALGFEGTSRRIGESLQPFYDVLVGGDVGEDRARLAERLGRVAAQSVPELVAEVLAKGHCSPEESHDVVRRFCAAAEGRL